MDKAETCCFILFEWFSWRSFIPWPTYLPLSNAGLSLYAFLTYNLMGSQHSIPINCNLLFSVSLRALCCCFCHFYFNPSPALNVQISVISFLCAGGVTFQHVALITLIRSIDVQLFLNSPLLLRYSNITSK